MAQEIVRRERQESALAESGRVVAMSAEPRGSITPVGVVIGAFVIGILTGAVGLFVAVLLTGS
jgi:hypothetical protein